MMLTIADRVGRWLDDVAAGMIAAVRPLKARGMLRLVEEEPGTLVIDAAGRALPDGPRRLRFADDALAGGAAELAVIKGRHIEMVLAADRFLFKPLELPTRATEFLGGIVRSQIDRLTPWNADAAAFGHTAPTDAGGGRIVVTVASTARSALRPLVEQFAAHGARSIAISTRDPAAPTDAAPILVLRESLSGVDLAGVRRVLLTILLAAALAAAGAVVAAVVIGNDLQARQDATARRIAERRATLLAAKNAREDPATAAERELARRKNETPSAVILLEVLSQILPDHTYVTELRLEDNKLRLTGISRDAPSLIRLIEQSHHFAHAAFFAPTTRAPSDPGDRFHIEMQTLPVFAVRP
jgi:general secretion pathway protein L